MKALVTGASGFIGGAVAAALLREGVQVRVLVRPGSAPNVEGEVEVARGDLRDPVAVRSATRGCGVVFHVGALYSLSASPEEIHASNVEGTRNVLEAALAEGVERVVHTSSVAAVRPARDGQPSDERCAFEGEPPGPYKRSKVESELLARSYHRERGLDLVIVNPTFPVGRGDVKPTPTGRVLVDFLNGRLPAYVDTGMNVVDVEDVALGHLLAWKRGRSGERYLLGHRNMSLREILEETGRLVGRAPPAVRLPIPLALGLGYLDRWLSRGLRREPRIPLEGVRTARHLMFVDCGRAVRELGLPQTPIPRALEKAIQWFEARGYVRSRAGA